MVVAEGQDAPLSDSVFEVVEMLGSEPEDRLAPVEATLRAAVDNGVPAESLSVTARWWQLESWLRTLVYLETRSAFGSTWQQQLDQRAIRRRENDRAFDYMATPSGENPINYMDVGVLFNLIAEKWEMFEPSLGPSQTVWLGRVDDLKRVRNRMAHCRRPHQDDQRRIEQLLRDLEPGARRAIDSYARLESPARSLDDPVVRDWLGAGHETARRLIQHGEDSYGIYFSLRYSIRPWAKSPVGDAPITGTSGVLWVMNVVLRDRWLHLADYWSSDFVKRIKSSIVFVTSASPTYLQVSFPAVDDPTELSDAIGEAFEGVFAESHPLGVGGYETASVRHVRQGPTIDSRVLVDDALALVDESAPRLSLFGVG